MRRVCAVLLSLAVLGTGVAAQQGRDRAGTPAPSAIGAAAIAGTVVTTSDPQRPLRRVAVTVGEEGNPDGGHMAVTDDNGRFVVAGLPAGRYVVTAAKPAYLATAHGASPRTRPGVLQSGTPVVLKDGETVDVTLRMARGAVITGTVRDESGKPMRDVSVALFYSRTSPQSGQPVLARYPSQFGGQTDSRGVYRIFGLPPGQYIVGVQRANQIPIEVPAEESFTRAQATRPSEQTAPVPPVRRAGFAAGFHPAALQPSGAATVTLAEGQERSGIDVTLQLVDSTQVTVTVSNVDGGPAPNVPIYVHSDLPSAGGGQTVFRTDATGQVVIRSVVPGSYVISTQVTSPVVAYAPIVATGGEVSVALQLQPGVAVSGHITVDGGAFPSGARPRLQLVPIETAVPLPGAVTVPVSPTGSFLAQVIPGRYRLTAAWPAAGGVPEHALQSARAGSDDLADAEFEVSLPLTDVRIDFGSKVSELSGRITDAAGQPAPGYFLIVFPKAESQWGWQARRIQQTRPSSDGRYVIRGLPAGEYVMAAVVDVDANEWFEPAFLRELAPASLAITITDGGRTTQDVRVR